jgi:hypothetical protein
VANPYPLTRNPGTVVWSVNNPSNSIGRRAVAIRVEIQQLVVLNGFDGLEELKQKLLNAAGQAAPESADPDDVQAMQAEKYMQVMNDILNLKKKLLTHRDMGIQITDSPQRIITIFVEALDEILTAGDWRASVR